ncbi:MAG TPA: DUF6599 family protein [Patescibacteria group bacterium]|nr:DUF6599 family protein [Patescibacteria group bacterium]
MNCPMRIALVVALVLAVVPPGGCRSGDVAIEDLLPATGEINGWEIDGEILRYGPDDLWEYIDGAAENFRAYEFVEVAVRDYLGEAGRGLKVEIYRHASPLMAFGIYSQFRGPGLRYLAIGAEGFGDAYSLHFWKDSYYVKVAVFEESGELAAAMERFAEAVAAKIPGAGSFPPEIACFPTAGLIEKSVTYVTEGVLGSGKFPPSFIAEYETGDKQGKMYLSPLEDDVGARRIFEWYAGSIGAAAEERETPQGGVTTAVGSDKYRGEVAVFRYGAWIGVFTGFGGHAREREALMLAAVANIARLAGMVDE